MTHTSTDTCSKNRGFWLYLEVVDLFPLEVLWHWSVHLRRTMLLAASGSKSASSIPQPETPRSGCCGTTGFPSFPPFGQGGNQLIYLVWLSKWGTNEQNEVKRWREAGEKAVYINIKAATLLACLSLLLVGEVGSNSVWINYINSSKRIKPFVVILFLYFIFLFYAGKTDEQDLFILFHLFETRTTENYIYLILLLLFCILLLFWWLKTSELDIFFSFLF